uniref:cell wall integrity and stress response component 4-like n=1 Tax=Erigeron canadensis TaxID=72917 RepID=UPI001CB99AFA|nr:cell wall integrity and stress response component 4-like [Erigeron canadensis]
MNTAEDATTTPISTIQRRNSIVTPSPLTLDPCSTTSSTPTTTTTSSSSSTDFELVSFKPASYTSLRDILPSTTSAIMSPTPPSFAVHSGYEISIRNRLVKQAAWAYLQPMSTSPDSGGSTIFHRVWIRFSGVLLRFVTHVCDCFLRSIQVNVSPTRL